MFARREMSMKFKRLILSVTTVVVALACAALSACRINAPSAYTESTAKINNPDQGFYRPIYVIMKDDGASYNKNIVTASTQLYHLRIDISTFSGAVNESTDKPLSQAALEGLDGLLSFLKTSDKNAVVRFAYDPNYGGAKDKEPALSMILQHIEQVCQILNNYESTITAVEAGLIGPWGEMHSSAIANAANITPIIDAFLNNTDNIPVLVRTPKMIYNYLGISIDDIDGYVIHETEKAYRLGLYNDGYLGSNSDLGTYTQREREIEFLSGQTEHLPYGGEVVIPSSNLHDIEVCLPEMYKINLSYLNVEWNNQVIDKWKNSKYTKKCGSDSIYYGKTAFNYIENRLGYRFVLKKSTLKYSDDLEVKIKLENVGFGNLNKKKRAKLILADEHGDIKFEKDVGDFSGESDLSFSTALNLDKGKYTVYLCLYGDELDGAPLYCVQFANDGIWNAELKANKLGEIEIKG